MVHSLLYSDYSSASTYSSVFTGSGEYIYIHESQVNQSTQLLSPFVRGPKCLRFYYYMHGSDIGNLDVLLWPREQQDNYLMWRGSGDQGDEWMKASVDVGYTGESQVGREQMFKAFVTIFSEAMYIFVMPTDRRKSRDTQKSKSKS